MPQAKTTEQRALAAIANKIDECYLKIERVEALLKKIPLHCEHPSMARPAHHGSRA
jgi:hypothetical protein